MDTKVGDVVEVRLDKIVGGGQVLGTLPGGKKVFVWGALPGELAKVRITRDKSRLSEAVAVDILEPSPDRVEPLDPASYLATSPWQIMDFAAEQRHKLELVRQAFELSNLNLPQDISIYSDDREYGYRNKIEYRFAELDGKLSLAFLERAGRAKIAIAETHLASPEVSTASKTILGVLNQLQVSENQVDKLLIRVGASGKIVWQLSVRDKRFPARQFIERLSAELQNGRVVLSPRNFGASPIELTRTGSLELSDQLLGQIFSYSLEGFFQINLPAYERALSDIKQFVSADDLVVDLFCGVGSIGLSSGASRVVLIESGKSSVGSAAKNIVSLAKNTDAKVVRSFADEALAEVSPDSVVIVDPPRAGLSKKLVAGLLDRTPKKFVYLSCNPVTQARDIAVLISQYRMIFAQAYNFFPKTPHIENLMVLERTASHAL